MNYSNYSNYSLIHKLVNLDFNIHLESHDGRVLFMYFASKNFCSAISGISTDYNTQLDHVFYRGFCPTVNFYESYFSDHKPMLMTFQREFYSMILTNFQSIVYPKTLFITTILKYMILRQM